MEKINVGIFIDSFFPMVDGVINVVDTQAKLLKDKCNISVFTVKPRWGRKDTIVHPYTTHKCNIMPVCFLDYDLPLPSLDRKFKKELKNSKLDIVYFHSPVTMAKVAIKYARKHNIPIISHLHSQFKRDYYRATHSKLITNAMLKATMNTFNNSDTCIAVNEFTKDLFVNEYGLKANTIVIPNATNLTPVDNKEEADKLVNEKFNLKEDEYIFTFVGRLNKLKNIDLILDALAIVKDKFTNFKMLMVGTGREENYFIKKVKKLGLQNYVIFTGKVTDKELMKAIYCRSNLFLFPSHYDTDGIVKFEAASQKTPTIFVENTGAASQIKDNHNGYISKSTPEDFANKILEVIENPELYETVCENAYKELYRTWQDSVDEVWSLISKLVEDNKNNGGKNGER